MGMIYEFPAGDKSRFNIQIKVGLGSKLSFLLTPGGIKDDGSSSSSN